MATFQLRRFGNPNLLRAIEPKQLLRFLTPYREFFSESGYELPPDETDEDIEYDQLIEIFMTPTESTPSDLLDAMFCVDEMSTPEGMESLLSAAKEKGVDIVNGEDLSPADVAVRLWLSDRVLLERKHAEQHLLKAKSFEYYPSGREPPPAPKKLPEAVIRRFEQDLDDWFVLNNRGRGTRVFDFSVAYEMRFLVRHGEPYRREESLADRKSLTVCYRPVKYDVVVFDRQCGDLRVNARLVGEKKLYRKQFGKYLFDDEDYFTGTAKYTLEPLQEDGEAALAVSDIDGIESIVLTEVEFLRGGAYRMTNVCKAEDVFAAARDCDGHTEVAMPLVPESAHMTKATFKVAFTGSRKSRSVKIRLPDVAEYTRDDDAQHIEEWLKRRGFMKPHKGR